MVNNPKDDDPSKLLAPMMWINNMIATDHGSVGVPCKKLATPTAPKDRDRAT